MSGISIYIKFSETTCSQRNKIPIKLVDLPGDWQKLRSLINEEVKKVCEDVVQKACEDVKKVCEDVVQKTCEDVEKICEKVKKSTVMEMKEEMRLTTGKYFKEIADIKIMLKTSQARFQGNSQNMKCITFQDSDESITLPLTSMDDLNLLEEKLVNETEKGSLISKLAVIGGINLKTVARHIMNTLLVKQVSLQFSLKGKGKLNKRCFEDLKLYDCIVGKLS